MDRRRREWRGWKRSAEGNHKQSPTAILGQRYVQRTCHTQTQTHTHRERRPLALVMVMYSRRHGMPTHRSDNLVARRRRKKKVVLCGVPVSSLVLESVLRNEDGKFQLSAVAEDVPMRLYKFFSMLWCFLLHVGTINCHCVRRDRSTNIHATHELCMILVVLVKSALDYALGDMCKRVCVC